MLAETSQTDITLLMARRLTKKAELDDLIRRSFQTTLESILQCEVFVWMNTIRHKWNGDSNSEESFLLAAVTSPMGGKAIGRTFPGLENNATFCKLSIGSLELECFTELKQIINKPWMDTFNVTQTIEIGKVEPGLVTGDILRELVGYTSHDVLGIAKCDTRFKEDRWDRWLLLVNTDKNSVDWENDPRPDNWVSKGWTHTIRRPPSPTRNSHDTRNFTTVTWDPDGCTVSKVSITPHPMTANPSHQTSQNSTASSTDSTADQFQQAKSRKGKKVPLKIPTAMPAGKTDKAAKERRDRLNQKPPGITILKRGDNSGTTTNNPHPRKHLKNPSVSFSSQEQLSSLFPSPKGKQNGKGSQGCYFQSLGTTLEISEEEFDTRVEKIREELELDSLSPEDCTEVLYRPLREAVDAIIPPPPNIPVVCSMILETGSPSVVGCIVSKNLLFELVEECLETILSYEKAQNRQGATLNRSAAADRPPKPKTKARPSEQMDTEPMGGHDVSKTN
jgi:hypothetical protein